MQLTDVCTKCKQQKPIEQFPKRGIGKRGQCHKCRSEYMVEWQRRPENKEKRKVYQARWDAKNVDRIREVGKVYAAKWREANPDRYKAIHSRKRFKRYGVDEKWYAEQSEKQGGLCAICGQVPNGHGLAIDHCHKTGRVRELLCTQCNTALHKMERDIDWIKQAEAYLMRHQCEA